MNTQSCVPSGVGETIIGQICLPLHGSRTYLLCLVHGSSLHIQTSECPTLNSGSVIVYISSSMSPLLSVPLLSQHPWAYIVSIWIIWDKHPHLEILHLTVFSKSFLLCKVTQLQVLRLECRYKKGHYDCNCRPLYNPSAIKKKLA